MSYFTLNNLWILLRQLADIACVWALVYYCLKIVKNNSRTIQIFKGILLVIIVKALATYLELNTIAAMTTSIMNWGVPAIIIIFQPEIRSILEKIGKTSVFSRITTLTVNERENLVDELVKACTEMSKTKTGALISIEQGHSLSDFIKTGTPMNSVVSSELLCSIFQYGTPLHDGAVIIQGVKIACAAAYFPPTSRELPTSYGARHRAAVGISEITDSITIVVSEETGNISIAQDGKLTVYSEASLKAFLLTVLGTKDGPKEKDKNKEKQGQKASEKEEAKVENNTKETSKAKKPSVFAHYFRNKAHKVISTPSVKEETKKAEEKDILYEQDVVIVEENKEPKEAMTIENLAGAQDAPLDQLFETIVEPTEVKAELEHKEEKVKEEAQKKAPVEEKPKKKRKRRTKAEIEADKAKEVEANKARAQEIAQTVEVKEKVKEVETIADNPLASMGLAQDLFDDIIEPEAIVLHYEKADEDEQTSPAKKSERSES